MSDSSKLPDDAEASGEQARAGREVLEGQGDTKQAGGASDVETAIDAFILDPGTQARFENVDGDGNGGRAAARRGRKQRRTDMARDELAGEDADGDDDRETTNLQKLMRTCNRRVRTEGAAAVASCIEVLEAALAKLEEEGEARSANYDMVLAFSLKSWAAAGNARQGLICALDQVATESPATSTRDLPCR
jgi:hypothetical protein